MGRTNSTSATILSVVRLLLLVTALIALPIPLAADDEEAGGCSANASHACARASGVILGYACGAGTSGGCEDCQSAQLTDMCFYADGPPAVGYKPVTQMPEGG